jgi:hypothetical protein
VSCILQRPLYAHSNGIQQPPFCRPTSQPIKLKSRDTQEGVRLVQIPDFFLVFFSICQNLRSMFLDTSTIRGVRYFRLFGCFGPAIRRQDRSFCCFATDGNWSKAVPCKRTHNATGSARHLEKVKARFGSRYFWQNFRTSSGKYCRRFWIGEARHYPYQRQAWMTPIR